MGNHNTKVCQVLTHYEYIDIELIEEAIAQMNETFPKKVQLIEVSEKYFKFFVKFFRRKREYFGRKIYLFLITFKPISFFAFSLLIFVKI